MKTRLLALLLLILPSVATAAPPDPPQAINYQAALLDDQGQPQTGSVDLTIRIFDTASGGTLVFTERFLGVVLTDGVFTVPLGPTGDATDTPVDPLTTSLLDALTADLGALNVGRFLELTVGQASPLARTPVLTVPYSLRAESAASADVAELAAGVQSIAGLPPETLDSMFQNWNFDGGPPASDPTEGTLDTDGDGILNFADSDNDGDTINDATEISTGSGINLVTPIVDSASPAVGGPFGNQTVTILGQNFESGLTIAFGPQNPTPFNVTATDFDIIVTPGVGVLDALVTLPNGETGFAAGIFSFDPQSPIQHGVSFGGPERYHVDLFSTQLLVGGQDAVAVDPDDDGSIGFQLAPFPGFNREAYAWDSLGRLSGLRCLNDGVTSDCEVQLVTDTDGDSMLEAGEEVVIETLSPVGTVAVMMSPGLAFDNAGRAVAGYVRRVDGLSEAIVAHDLEGDGDFDGPNEHIVLESTGIVDLHKGAVAVDSTGRVAYLYWQRNNQSLRLAFDRNGDGDFADFVGSGGELREVTATTGLRCMGVTFDENDHLALVYDGNLLRDLDEDFDFVSADESIAIAPTATACDIAGGQGATGIAIAHNVNGLQLIEDTNGDLSFDPVEQSQILGGSHTKIGLAREAGAEFIAVPAGVVVNPTNP